MIKLSSSFVVNVEDIMKSYGIIFVVVLMVFISGKVVTQVVHLIFSVNV